MRDWFTSAQQQFSRSQKQDRSVPRRALRGFESLEDRRVLSASGGLFELPPEAPKAPEVGGAVPGELLVRFRDGVTDQEIQGLYRAQGLAEIERLYNASDVAGTRRVAVPEAALAAVARALQNNPNVHYAEPNVVASTFFAPNDPYYGYQWNFSNAKTGGINIGQAWDTSTGANAVVAVLDTGVAYENYQDATGIYSVAPDLAATRFVPGYDFINNDAHANDDHSHGTHVAGTIAQSTDNARGVAGVAFGASVMPVKVLGSDGSGSHASIASGVRWAADHGAHVINLSLGSASGSQTLQDALAYAYGKGVTIIAAAGNDGQNAVSYPAAYDDYVIAVSATRYDESLAYYSNFGASIDLAAPGGDVNVDQNGDGYADGILQNTFNPSTKNTGEFNYYFFQGTSMAAPHVAGVAALLVSQGVSDPLQVRSILESTAEDKGTTGLDQQFGYGIVDAAAAMAAIGVVNTAPVAVDDAVATLEATSVTISVLANDSDPDGDALTVSGAGPAVNGLATVNLDNTISYIPNLGFSGTDTFNYTVADGRGGSATAVVSVTVSDVNAAPIAADDLAATIQDTPVTIAVLANDSDLDGDALRIASFTAPANGNVTENSDGTLTYSPKAGYSGSDSFTYTISDPAGATDTATVSVTVGTTVLSNSVQVVDLDGTAITDRSRWGASVRVLVADAGGTGVAGVTVSGRWSDGKSFSGTTDTSGYVKATSAWLQKKASSITFTVEDVAHPDYDPTLNRDADGDSDGTSILVYKDGTTAAAGFRVSAAQSGDESLPELHGLESITTGHGDERADGRKSLKLDFESIKRQYGEQARLIVRHGDEVDLELGEGWKIGPPQVVADQVLHILTQNGVEMQLGNGRPWTNPLDAADVNYNNKVDASDALWVLNFLNRENSGELDQLAGDSGSSLQYFDTTGDGRVGAIDALQVINALARGEATVAPPVSGELAPITGSGAATTLRDEAVLAWVEEQQQRRGLAPSDREAGEKAYGIDGRSEGAPAMPVLPIAAIEARADAAFRLAEDAIDAYWQLSSDM